MDKHLMNSNQVVVKTIVHLKDRKGFTCDKEHDGDFCSHMFNIRVRSFASGTDLPVGYLRDEPKCEMIDHEFEFRSVEISNITSKYVIKHMYYQEKE